MIKLCFVRGRPLFYFLTSCNTYKGVDWIDLAQGSVIGSCEQGNEHTGPLKAGISLISQSTISFSRRTILDGIHLIT
jgi:hypothetical protein